MGRCAGDGTESGSVGTRGDVGWATCPLWASALSLVLSSLPRDLGVLEASQPSPNPHLFSSAGRPDHLDQEI